MDNNFYCMKGHKLCSKLSFVKPDNIMKIILFSTWNSFKLNKIDYHLCVHWNNSDINSIAQIAEKPISFKIKCIILMKSVKIVKSSFAWWNFSHYAENFSYFLKWWNWSHEKDIHALVDINSINLIGLRHSYLTWYFIAVKLLIYGSETNVANNWCQYIWRVQQ